MAVFNITLPACLVYTRRKIYRYLYTLGSSSLLYDGEVAFYLHLSNGTLIPGDNEDAPVPTTSLHTIPMDINSTT